MEKKKKFYPRDNNAQKDSANGQRISVRPGNFNPPGERPAQKPAEQQRPQGEQARPTGEGGAHKNNRRNNHHRHDRHGHKPQGEQRKPQNELQKPAEQQQNQQSEQREQRDRHHDRNRRSRNRNRRGPREESVIQQQQQPKEAPQLSEDLQRELDEEFSAPLSSFSTPSLFSAPKKTEEQSFVDSEEFAVDIATASYLVEDVPCGFPVPDGKAVEVIGVRFRRAGRIYFFAPSGFKFAIGDHAIVDTARGEELGDVVMLNRRIAEKDVVQPLRSVLRPATPEDVAHDEENRKKEAEALKVCAEKIAWHKLDMRLVDAQYTFDNSKLLFYFTSDGRVDFRELVRDLAGHFHTRIELRQIGIRDESRLIGGLGICGRPFCCTTFLSDFGQVSVKMAKEQGLSINASKISGCCGRLMCCLRYEHDTYVAEAKLTPKKDTVVNTPDGKGIVIDSTPLAGTVKVRLDDLPDEQPRVYHRDDVTPLSRERNVEKSEQQPSAPAENDEESSDALPPEND